MTVKDLTSAEASITTHLQKNRGWIFTFTGRKFYPLDPKVEDLDIKDIAHALSCLARYNGHTSRFYSVAEHSTIMAQVFLDKFSVQSDYNNIDLARWALLHDAAEAYLGDLVRPLKQLPEFRFFVEAEDRYFPLLAEKFGLVGTKEPEAVKSLDLDMCAHETKALRVNLHDWVAPCPIDLEIVKRIKALEPSFAEYQFLSCYGQLFGDYQPLHDYFDKDNK